MLQPICLRLAILALIGAVPAHGALAASSRIAAGQQGQDGLYAVDAMTRQGDCDRVYNWLILVTGGRVSAAGDTPLEAAGHINSRGVVKLRFERFGQVANVTGRVLGGSGSGTWISPTLRCSGSWRAMKRGPAGH